jgi:hypothetical protein
MLEMHFTSSIIYWTYIYIENCMYIFKYCYCVIVIHFINLSWIHDLVAVMKPIMEGRVVCYETAFEITSYSIVESWDHCSRKPMFICSCSGQCWQHVSTNNTLRLTDVLPPCYITVSWQSLNSFPPWFINAIISIPLPC